MESAETKREKRKEINSKQRQYLKGLAHPFTPLVQIGKEGMSESLVEMTKKELALRELLKVKIGNNSGLEKHAAAEELAAKTDSILVQLIGKTIILYKENLKKPKKERIYLPKG